MELEREVSQDAAIRIPQRRRAGAIRLAKQIAGVELQRESEGKVARLQKLRAQRAETFRRYA